MRRPQLGLIVQSAHHRRREPRHADDVEEEQVDALVPLGVRQVEQIPLGHMTRIVDHGIQASIRRTRGLDGARQVLRDGHGAADTGAAELGRERLHVTRTRHQHQPEAPAPQLAGTCRAHPPAGGGDERDGAVHNEARRQREPRRNTISVARATPKHMPVPISCTTSDP